MSHFFLKTHFSRIGANIPLMWFKILSFKHRCISLPCLFVGQRDNSYLQVMAFFQVFPYLGPKNNEI